MARPRKSALSAQAVGAKSSSASIALFRVVNSRLTDGSDVYDIVVAETVLYHAETFPDAVRVYGDLVNAIQPR